MSYRFSYDLAKAESDNRSRIRLIFERFGWQSIGGSALRSPAAGKHAMENFFGQVLPPLWYFRSLVVAKSINVKAYSVAANAEADYQQNEFGHAILPVSDLQLYPSRKSKSTQNRLSESCLRTALQATELALA